MSMEYTAHDMREQSKFVLRAGMQNASDMLRQAAEMVERCEKIVNDLKFALQETVTISCSITAASRAETSVMSRLFSSESSTNFAETRRRRRDDF